MTIEDVFLDFCGEDFIPPRIIRANYSFNGEGISLYYYIDGKDSDGLVAGLKLDFFSNVRFTNFKKPHPTPDCTPYFDKFRHGWSCSDDEILNCFVLSNSMTITQLDRMARHWRVSVKQYINTLLLAYTLLKDAENDNWLNGSNWEGGEFRGLLPPRKR